MEGVNAALDYFVNMSPQAHGIVAFVLGEVFVRKYPTANPKSLITAAAAFAGTVSKVLYLIADDLNGVVPQNIKPPET